MRKLICRMLVLAFLVCLSPAPPARAESGTVLRALLVGGDRFVTQEDTSPSAGNNVTMLADTLMLDARRYSLVRSLKNSVATVEELANAVWEAFELADEDDISLFYISTHGILDDTGQAALVLSDGEREELLTRDALHAIFRDIPGKKVLVLDACYAGAFIGKGLRDVNAANPFAGDDFCVLAASGGEEPSFYWRSADGRSDALRGGSYFASMLSGALRGACPADIDRDGGVTMREMLAYSLENYAPSTPQIYPQDARDVFFERRDGQFEPDERPVSDVVFDDVVLSPSRRDVTFSFTVRRRTRVSYMLVYHRDGAWDFDGAQTLNDDETGRGELLPGRKERRISLSAGGAYGYVMLVLLTVEEDAVAVAGSWLLCVQRGDEGFSAEARAQAAFSPEAGEEMRVFIAHETPCTLTADVRDASGTTVRKLCWQTPSRPQTKSPGGTCLYWDGLTALGEPAPPGVYTVAVTASSGDQRVTTVSNEVIVR